MSKTKQRKSTAGKSIAIFFIVFIILEGLIIFGLKTIFKTEDSVPSLANYSFFLMDSDKMSPSIPKNTLVVAVNGTPSADKLRNAVLCRNVGSEGTTVAWLYMIGSKGDTVNGVVYTVFQCQGDEPENDPNVEYIDVESEDVVGVAVSHYMTAGKIISFVITPFGMIICLAVPLIMLVLLELVVAITNRSEDDSYEPEGYGRDPRFYNQQGNRQQGQQNGNASLDDFLYGGSNDEVYNGGRPDEDYAEEFAEDRRAPANRQQRPAGKPDFNVNDEYGDDFEENDPFGDEEENSFADSVFGQSEEEAPAQFFKPDEAPEAEPFADDDDFEEDEIFAEPAPAAPAKPAVDREYYEKAARMIEGDDYQPAPAPVQQPAPAPQLTKPVQQPAQPVMNLEKPAAPARQQAPARQPAPARAEQPARQPVARRRPSQPPQGAPRRRPAGAAPTRSGAAPQRRPRPAQPRPGAQRRPVPHKNANAALADLTAKMQAEQQKLGNNQ